MPLGVETGGFVEKAVTEGTGSAVSNSLIFYTFTLQFALCPN